MPKGDIRHYKVEDVEAALRASAGIHSAAARILATKYGKCSPNTVKNYILRYPKLKAVQDDILNANLDLAESALLIAIKASELKAVMFYLRTKGKGRGYSERLETTGADGGAIETETKVDLSSFTAEERDALRPILERRLAEARGRPQ